MALVLAMGSHLVKIGIMVDVYCSNMTHLFNNSENNYVFLFDDDDQMISHFHQNIFDHAESTGATES